MDAVEFFKTVNRLCKNQGCNVCPVAKEGICMVGFDDDSAKNIEETISKVEQWAKDHPVKTRQSEFLKLFPKAAVCDGMISLCPLFYCSRFLGTYFAECNPSDCEKCKREYWLTEVIDND